MPGQVLPVEENTLYTASAGGAQILSAIVDDQGAALGSYCAAWREGLTETLQKSESISAMLGDGRINGVPLLAGTLYKTSDKLVISM